MKRYPASLPDVRRSLAAGDVVTAIWQVIDMPAVSRWLTDAERGQLAAAGCPGWAIGREEETPPGNCPSHEEGLPPDRNGQHPPFPVQTGVKLTYSHEE